MLFCIHTHIFVARYSCHIFGSPYILGTISLSPTICHHMLTFLFSSLYIHLFLPVAIWILLSKCHSLFHPSFALSSLPSSFRLLVFSSLSSPFLFRRLVVKRFCSHLFISPFSLPSFSHFITISPLLFLGRPLIENNIFVGICVFLNIKV